VNHIANAVHVHQQVIVTLFNYLTTKKPDHG
jgi:hypothetical protein